MRVSPGLVHRVFLLPIIAGAAFVFSLATPAIAASHAVSIIDFGYTPASVTVQVGDTVVWTNTGRAVHTVSADNGSFDSGTLLSGRTFAMTFSAPGTFTYHCNVHPSMHGTVVVERAAAAAPAASAPTTAAPARSQPAAPAAGAPQTAPTKQLPAAAIGGSAAPGATVVRAMPATGSGGAPAQETPVLLLALGALMLGALGGTLYHLARRS